MTEKKCQASARAISSLSISRRWIPMAIITPGMSVVPPLPGGRATASRCRNSGFRCADLAQGAEFFIGPPTFADFQTHRQQKAWILMRSAKLFSLGFSGKWRGGCSAMQLLCTQCGRKTGPVFARQGELANGDHFRQFTGLAASGRGVALVPPLAG